MILDFSGIIKKKKAWVITDPAAYLREKKAEKDDEYILEKQSIISGTGNAKCSDFGGGNNCTLTGLYNIMVYYRIKGYKKIPDNDKCLYEAIKNQAQELGYNRKNGISVIKNSRLVKRVWQSRLGYTSGEGRSCYLWRHVRFIKEIDSGRPFLFSLACGVYFNHTVVVYGYEVYKNLRTGREYIFLVVADAWSNQSRYMAFTHTGARYISCATFVVPALNE